MSTQPQSPLSPLDLVERCIHCGGDGVFRKADKLGHMVPFGPCFQCVGKGFLTPEDFRRNERYQEHALARAMAGDRAQLTLDEFFTTP